MEREKALTREADALNKERRALPLVEITKPYTFVDSETGSKSTLTDLFQGRKQLVLYHAMFDPSWENACESCTLLLDHIPPLEHLNSRGTTFVVVSRASPEQIKAYKAKMGWDRFKWYSSGDTDFNADFQVTQNPDVPLEEREYNYRRADELVKKGLDFFTRGEQPGHSIFVMGGSEEEGGVGRGEAGKVYHSYSSYARGGEPLITTFKWLDWTPMGRQDEKKKGLDGLRFKRRFEYTAEDLAGT